MDEWRMGVKGTKLGMDAVGLVKRTKLEMRGWGGVKGTKLNMGLENG